MPALWRPRLQPVFAGLRPEASSLKLRFTLLSAPFENGGGLTCSATPAGPVATVAHFGPHNEMHKGYDALFKWCNEHGRILAGPFWEIYGDWEDDPAKLRTDVYCLLR